MERMAVVMKVRSITDMPLDSRRMVRFSSILNTSFSFSYRSMMWVKVTEIDEKGRVNLSHKDAVKDIEAKKAAGEPIK